MIDCNQTSFASRTSSNLYLLVFLCINAFVIYSLSSLSLSRTSSPVAPASTNTVYHTFSLANFIDGWQFWDGEWNIGIALHGYEGFDDDWKRFIAAAYPPGYPYLLSELFLVIQSVTDLLDLHMLFFLFNLFMYLLNGFLLAKLLSQEDFYSLGLKNNITEDDNAPKQEGKEAEDQQGIEQMETGDEYYEEETEPKDLSSRRERDMWRIISLFIASPPSLLFHTFTPDVFFLTLCLLSLLLIGQRRFVMASIFIFFVMFVSPSGILFLVILLWEFFDSVTKGFSSSMKHQIANENESQWRNKQLQVEEQRRKEQIYDIIFSIFIVIFSIFAFFRFYLFKYWDRFAFFDAMKNGWNRRFKNPFETIFFGFVLGAEALLGKHLLPLGADLRTYLINVSPWRSVGDGQTGDQWESFFDCTKVNQRPSGYCESAVENFGYFLVGFCLLNMCLISGQPMRWKIFSFCLFLLPLIQPALQNPLALVPKYLAINFPLYIVLAVNQSQSSFLTILSIFGLMKGILVSRFVTGRWALQ